MPYDTLNASPHLDPSNPATPAYMRAGMSDVERYVTLRDTVVTVLFGSKAEAKGENLEDVP